ncbi:integrase catalytic domain-containing protein [Trichonephila clavipes]|nr:integrase catalytic domain-containing protein [Trichonephila clavipes]
MSIGKFKKDELRCIADELKLVVPDNAKVLDLRELIQEIVKKITDLTPSQIINGSLNKPSEIKLADYKFNVPGKIDVLLGAEIFYELLRPGQIYCGDSRLLLQITVFGYVVNGSVGDEVRDRCEASACERKVLKEEMGSEKSDEDMKLPQETERVLPPESERAKMLSVVQML